MTPRSTRPIRLAALLLVTLALAIQSPVPARAQETVSLTRQDQRVVAAIAYAPKAAACRGVAVISHGAGGSEQGYRYLGEALSGLGYLAVVVDHPESGREVLREYVRTNRVVEGLTDLIARPSAYVARFIDIAAARTWARGRCDGPETILAGHSMGAATTLLEAGAKNRLGLTGSDAFDAYIALSPQGPGSIFPPDAWQNIRKPVLSITGTRDGALGAQSWETRLAPFANLPGGCHWQLVVQEATHMHFAGTGGSARTEALVLPVIAGFLDGARRKDCAPIATGAGAALQTK